MKPTVYMAKETEDEYDDKFFWENPNAPDGEVVPLYEIDFTKYKLVPLEPTEEMIDVGVEHDVSSDEENDVIRWCDAYGKIIEAAPDIGDL